MDTKSINIVNLWTIQISGSPLRMASHLPWTSTDDATCREPRSGGVYVYMGASEEISGYIWAEVGNAKAGAPHGNAMALNPSTAFNFYAL